MPSYPPIETFEQSIPDVGSSANESSFKAAARDDDAPVSGFGDGDVMNVAVRMVIPFRREFGRLLDVPHFLHDPGYARDMIKLAQTSRDARLRAYGVFLERRMGPLVTPPTPGGSVLATPAAQPRDERPVGQSPQVALQDARKACARHLTAVLGPTATPLCLRIEAARTPAELLAAARRAHAVVREVRGAAQAERFGALVEPLLKALSP